jgi:hypothetical protein
MLDPLDRIIGDVIIGLEGPTDGILDPIGFIGIEFMPGCMPPWCILSNKKYFLALMHYVPRSALRAVFFKGELGRNFEPRQKMPRRQRWLGTIFYRRYLGSKTRLKNCPMAAWSASPHLEQKIVGSNPRQGVKFTQYSVVVCD